MEKQDIPAEVRRRVDEANSRGGTFTNESGWRTFPEMRRLMGQMFGNTSTAEPRRAKPSPGASWTTKVYPRSNVRGWM